MSHVYTRACICARVPRVPPRPADTRVSSRPPRVFPRTFLFLSHSHPTRIPSVPRFSSILFPRLINATPSFSIPLRVRVRLYMCVSASISFHSCALVTHGHRRIRAGFARGTVAVGRRGGLHGRRVMIFRAHYEIFEMICRDCAF